MIRNQSADFLTVPTVGITESQVENHSFLAAAFLSILESPNGRNRHPTLALLSLPGKTRTDTRPTPPAAGLLTFWRLRSPLLFYAFCSGVVAAGLQKRGVGGEPLWAGSWQEHSLCPGLAVVPGWVVQ